VLTLQYLPNPPPLPARFFFPKYGAYKWFTGPAKTVDVEDSVMDIGDAASKALD
jgi:hypothetical protein